jgi:orotate phosphoribosyltransferase
VSWLGCTRREVEIKWLSRLHCGTARNSKLDAWMSHSTKKAVTMPNSTDSKTELLRLLRKRSVAFGNFTLSSGATSSYYVDCKLTTLSPEGALLVGQIFYQMIREEAVSLGVHIDAVGGLTMGADPIALAVGMFSVKHDPSDYFEVFSVRKSAKEHGRHKLVEGNFNKGDRVVVIDDVVTRGESTLQAINAVEQEGGSVEFVVVLVDRQEGGREKIEQRGYKVVSLFNISDILSHDHTP